MAASSIRASVSPAHGAGPTPCRDVTDRCARAPVRPCPNTCAADSEPCGSCAGGKRVLIAGTSRGRQYHDHLRYADSKSLARTRWCSSGSQRRLLRTLAYRRGTALDARSQWHWNVLCMAVRQQRPPRPSDGPARRAEGKRHRDRARLGMRPADIPWRCFPRQEQPVVHQVTRAGTLGAAHHATGVAEVPCIACTLVSRPRGTPNAFGTLPRWIAVLLCAGGNWTSPIVFPILC